MTNFIKSFAADQSGASAAEYALILAIVGAGIGAAAWALGGNIKDAIGAAGNHVTACSSANSSSGTAPSGC